MKQENIKVLFNSTVIHRLTSCDVYINPIKCYRLDLRKLSLSKMSNVPRATALCESIAIGPLTS